MKLKISLLLIFLFLTVNEIQAQPGFNEPYNPFYPCQINRERNKYFFYGEIVALELLTDVYVNSMTTSYKAVVKVEKFFGEELPLEITLYISYKASHPVPLIENKYLFQAVDGKLNKQKVYFTEFISRPMTDYSAQAVREVFDGIEWAFSNKNENFIEGAIFEYLSRVRDVLLKTEDADRLAKDIRNSQPLPDIFLKAVSEKNGKVYEARSDENGRFRIDNIPPGLYKIKLDLPEDYQQEEPFIYGVNASPCSRKWYVPVRRKPQNDKEKP